MQTQLWVYTPTQTPRRTTLERARCNHTQGAGISCVRHKTNRLACFLHAWELNVQRTILVAVWLESQQWYKPCRVRKPRLWRPTTKHWLPRPEWSQVPEFERVNSWCVPRPGCVLQCLVVLYDPAHKRATARQSELRPTPCVCMRSANSRLPPRCE